MSASDVIITINDERIFLMYIENGGVVCRTNTGVKIYRFTELCTDADFNLSV
ncbi:MAG: hypothetical protein ACLTCI_03840 [[Clostridium] nexile]